MDFSNIKLGGVSADDTTSSDNKRISLMIWGQAGCGKTTLASTAPGKICWLLFDPNGSDSLKQLKKYQDGDIAVFDMSKQNYSIVMQGCMDNCFGLETYLKDNTFDD